MKGQKMKGKKYNQFQRVNSPRRRFPDGSNGAEWMILLECCAGKACGEPGEIQAEFMAPAPWEIKRMISDAGWDVAESHVGTGYEVVEGVEHWAACPACAASEEE